MTAPHGQPTSTDLLLLLRSLAQLGSKLTLTIRDFTPETTLSGNQVVAILTHLSTDGPLRPVEAARIIGFTTGGTTKVLDRMVQGGLISRVNPPRDELHDRRAKFVTITPKGEQLLQSICTALTDASPLAADIARQLQPFLPRD